MYASFKVCKAWDTPFSQLRWNLAQLMKRLSLKFSFVYGWNCVTTGSQNLTFIFGLGFEICGDRHVNGADDKFFFHFSIG